MEKSDLKEGSVYCSKRPRVVRRFLDHDVYDDRQIVWLGFDSVQYDSPTVQPGRRLPTISIEKFLKWAGEEVTQELEDRGWRKVGD